MLRHVLLFAGFLVAATCLVAAAEPESPVSSNWMPAGQARESVYRPSEAEPALIPVAQSGPSNLADRLKAIRSTGAPEPSGGVSSRRVAPPATIANDSPGKEAPGEELPSVLVRRGGSGASDAAAPDRAAPDRAAADTPVADSGSEAESAVEAAAEPAENPVPRTARRTRRDTETFRSPVTLPSTPNASTGSQLSLSSQGPMLTVETEGPRSIVMGKEANYRVRLVNQGSAEAERVIVTVAIPAWVQIASTQARSGSVKDNSKDNSKDGNEDGSGRQIFWEMEHVAASSQHELAISLQPTENRPLDLVVDWVFRAAPLQAKIEVQQPQLTMAVEGPTEMRFGETATFTVKLSNPGNGPAENVAVNVGATGATSQPNTIGTLGAAESRVMEIELTAKQAGTMKIQATAQGDGDLRAAATHDVRIRRAQLAVKVTAPTLIYAGATATYEIRVANTGDAVAEGVTLHVQLPPGNKNAVGVDKKPITITKDPPQWQLGELAPGSDRVYTMQCDLVTGGPCQFAARIQAKDESVASDTATITVEAIADLKLIVNDPQGPLPVGKEVTYEIQIVNRGSREANNIDLVAQFADGIEPATVAGHRSEIVPGQVIFEPIRSLPAGGSVTVKIVAKAQKAGNLQFRAELKCSELETKLVSEGSTRFYGSAADNSAPQSAQRPAGEPVPAQR
ncbi:MAG: COG1361 S-layer family protein [Pirellulaceae bacterium]